MMIHLVPLGLLVLTLSSCGNNSAPEESIEYAIQGLYSAAFSANGERAIVGSINHGASLWQFDLNERQYNWNHKQGDYSQVIAADFSPSGDYAITATPQTMVLWNAENGEGLSYWTAPSEIFEIALLNGGNFALLGLEDHSAALFDVKNGGVNQVYYHDARVNTVDVNADQTRVLSGSDDYSARLWDINTGEELQRWNHADEVQLVKFSPDGNWVFTMAKYDKAAIWNAADGSLQAEIPLGASAIRRGKEYTAAAFSDDSRYLLTGTANRLVQLWEIKPMRRVEQWKIPRRNPASPTSASILSLAFGKNNNYYAISSDGFAHRLR